MSKPPQAIWREAGLVALLVLFVGLGLFYSWIIPLYEGPDEYAHFRYITHLVESRQPPTFDVPSTQISAPVVQQPPFYYALAASVVAWTPIDAALADITPNPYLVQSLSHRAFLTLPDATATGEIAPRAARLVSLLGATLAVWGTWLLARRLLPQWWWAPFVAAALVGFNPQFLFSAATVTNDAWAAVWPVWALWLALKAERAAHPWRLWLGVGLLLGAGLLTKYSTLTVIAPLVIVALVQANQRGWRTLAQDVLSATLGFALVAGWWIVRNLNLTGEWLPVPPSLLIQPSISWNDATLWEDAGWLLRSYWGVFGNGIVAPASYYNVVQNMLLFALVGYVMWGVWALLNRQWFDQPYRAWLPVLLAASWFLLSAITLLNTMRSIRFSDQGRLLFAAVPAVALLMLMGWAAWSPRRGQAWLATGALLLVVSLGLSQMTTLHAAYALPPAIAEPLAYDRPIEARFTGGMTLLGIDLPEGAAVNAGGTLPLILYWTTGASIAENYTLFLHLADSDNQMLYQFDGVPYQGRHPTRQWLPGQVFADHYVLQVGELPSDQELGVDGLPTGESRSESRTMNRTGAESRLATLSVGFYPYDRYGQRQPATSLATGAELGDRIPLANVRVHAEAVPLPSLDPPVARWQEEIELADYDVTQNAAAVPRRVMLRWEANQTLHRDYTFFVQLLDANNQVVAQVDRQPWQGEWPTSTWRRGDVIEDSVLLPPAQDGRQGEWTQLIVGFYDQSGTVLGVVEPGPQGYVTLLRAE